MDRGQAPGGFVMASASDPIDKVRTAGDLEHIAGKGDEIHGLCRKQPGPADS
eukprot:CAMPEP_0171112542 /NCGR_PEP_ID=MMETSP0766_2-20121228/79460_1 /TAXON_ID=439317 /ORGANISM="Gambierdiscus australes, Strain CAWD 149" /LENGTH=51 /DNA_ID=CAMNT_0011574659 /DNA_START=327 /DNA_END=479 /DNA_ORIENTATION=-